MAITIRSTFVVDAPTDQAWASLTDIEQSAPCFPGAELKEQLPDGSYKGGFTVKLGPMSFKFNGKFKLTDQDDAARTFTVIASGTDTKGRGGADAKIQVALVEETGKSRVNVVSDVNLSGTVAQYGRGVGMIEALSKQLLEQFGKNLAAQILSQTEVEQHVPVTELTASPASQASYLSPPATLDPTAPSAFSPVGGPGTGQSPVATPSVDVPAQEGAPTFREAAGMTTSANVSDAQVAGATPSATPAAAQAARPAAAGGASVPPVARPRRVAPPAAPLDAGSLMRQAMWHSVRGFFARLFGRGQPR